MADHPSLLFVGGGLASARAAVALRSDGFAGRIHIVGEEAHAPYDRPPLSKQMLAASADAESCLLHPLSFYTDQRIELRTGARVVAVEPEAKRVWLADGEEVAYDRLLLATGSRPRRLAIAGDDLAGVHYLRTLADCLAI